VLLLGVCSKQKLLARDWSHTLTLRPTFKPAFLFSSNDALCVMQSWG
jgi:hypothetical protein